MYCRFRGRSDFKSASCGLCNCHKESHTSSEELDEAGERVEKFGEEESIGSVLERGVLSSSRKSPSWGEETELRSGTNSGS